MLRVLLPVLLVTCEGAMRLNLAVLGLIRSKRHKNLYSASQSNPPDVKNFELKRALLSRQDGQRMGIVTIRESVAGVALESGRYDPSQPC